MPLHLPQFSSHRRRESEVASSSPQSEKSDTGFQVTRRSSLSPTSPTSPTSSLPPSILRHAGSSESSSTVDDRLSKLSINREDTIGSSHFSDHDPDSPYPGSAATSTPATSVSSLSQCPLPPSSATQRFPFFVLSLSSTSTLQFIALPLSMRPAVLDAINRSWKRGIDKVRQVEYAPELMRKHSEKGCDSGVWEVVLKGDCWVPRSEDRVSSKRILINLMVEFAKEGYSLNSSFRTSAKDSGKDTLTFLRDAPDPDPTFFCVGFHSSDRIWIIDAEADVGEKLENGIREWWTDGIRDARVRERHCREIRLKGTPWTSHNTSSLISARCIHLVIMKCITGSGEYAFVGSVDMSDKEEGQMPAIFYRKRREGEVVSPF